MDPFDLMTKSSAFKFSTLRDIMKTLHSGARAEHAGLRVAHANKMVGKYQGDTGMGWRVDMANKSIAKNAPKQVAYQQTYDDFLNTLTPKQQKALDYGRGALSTIYDLPKMLIASPTSKTGILGSMGIYTGAGLMGFNIDPYSRAGQMHGLTNAKDIATNYGTQGGYQAANDLLTGFDSLNMGDRWKFAKNPTAISDSVTPTSYNPSGSKFNLNSFLMGAPDMFDNAITTGIAQQVNNFKM